MTTDSSILARRILWTQEPSGLQSVGSHRVRYDCGTEQNISLFFYLCYSLCLRFFLPVILSNIKSHRIEILYPSLMEPKLLKAFPGGASGKELACQCRTCKGQGFDPWVGGSLGGGHGTPLCYSCLESLLDRGAWRATVQRLQRVGHD